MRIVLKIEYDGTSYCGWQVQPNGVSIEQKIEEAIFTVTKENVKLFASGRTDSGVHAKGQIAHFDTNANILPSNLKRAINTYLPQDIKIVDCVKANEDFHARFSAKRKTYSYSIYVCEYEQPLKSRYSVNIKTMPNVDKINECLNILKGEHDFKCFLASNSQIKSTVRTIYQANLIIDGDNLKFVICGNGFLYNMVRIIVGSLLKVGFEKMTVDEFKQALILGDRKKMGKTMPAKALCLESVEYV